MIKHLYTLCRQGKQWLADKSNPYNIQNILAAVVADFFAVTSLCMATADAAFSNMPAFMNGLNLSLFAVLLVAVTLVLVLFTRLVGARRVLPPALLTAVTAFCVCLQEGGDRDVWTAVGMALFLYLVCTWLYTRFKKPFGAIKPGWWFVRIAVTAMFAVFVLWLSYMGYARFYSFTYNSFDFGIFAQMFDSMKETGLPYTTVERNTLLSHFAVHFSPFFYVLLPGYCLFPNPVYLCVAQTLFVGAGVFAVYGIARHFDFTPKQTLLSCTVYLLYPAFSFGLFWDFHENKFLAFCILFAVYFMLRRQWVPFYIFAVLLCSVKEDAAIYLVAIALFMLAHEKQTKHGVITLVLALGYFVFALKMVALISGSEGMEFGYRYSNFELDGPVSIGAILRVLVADFGYAFKQMFQAEKVEFLLWLFLPVLLTPFATRKVSVLLLLTPMVLVNLLTNWVYQYDVDFQYTYGSGAMIVVATLVVIARLKPAHRGRLLAAMAALCLAMTVPRVVDRTKSYVNSYLDNREMFHQSVDYLHENLDKAWVIGASNAVVPVLYDYPRLYLDPHESELLSATVEYYVVKLEEEDAINIMEERGFEKVKDNGYVAIYHNTTY